MKTVVVTEDVLEEAKRIARSTSDEQVVEQALREFASRHDQRKLVKFLGTFDDFLSPRELDAMRNDT
jgi:hypothetical protein